MKIAPLAGSLTVALLALAVCIPAMRQTLRSPVEAVRLSEDNWDSFVPQGKEVDAIYGDIVLRNAHLVAVIAQPLPTRNANMTVKEVGGALIDFTTREQPSDQLSAFYPGRRNYKYRFADLCVENPLNPGPRTDDPLGTPVSGDAVRILLESAATDTKPQVTTTYRLAADNPFLEVITIFQNPGAAALSVDLEDDVRLDGGKEDMIKSPNGEAKSFRAYDRHWNQAYGVSLVGNDRLTGDILMNSDARLSAFSYKTADGKTAVTLAPGESFALTRRLWAAGDLLQLHEAQAHAEQRPLKTVRFAFLDGTGRPIARAFVELRSESGAFDGSARTSADGKLQTSLPEGKYAVRVTSLGRRLDRDDMEVLIGGEKSQFDFAFADYQTGRVEAAITDAAGNPIPCKVEFRPTDAALNVDFGPESAEFAVKNLRYAPDGKFSQELPVGEYDVLISHGPEFDFVERRLTIAAGKTANLSARLVRSVDTAGWVSSDFHSHSSPSGDNTGSQLGRVLNLVCEHIEFGPCTEHNRVDTYVPHIERLGIAKFLATVSGMELTGQPLPLNHQNAFPLKMTPRTQDNGGPLTLDNLEDQIERLALWDDRGEKLVQVNHPDLGWMFYDKNGDGQPDAGFERAVPYMDVMEIHPVDSALHLGPVREFSSGQKFHNTIFRWLQLLNQGYRIYGVVNTDAHYNYHGSGGVRNWIQSPTDDPAHIDPLDMVRAAEQGRLTMSNGPFLEVRAGTAGQPASVTCGQDLLATDKRVELKVRVQCPNWLDVNRVFVLVNGRIAAGHDYSREKHPELFRSGTVKFERTLELTLAADSHLIVVAGQEGGSVGKAMGPQYGRAEPAAMTNPIFVDIDGNGFQPNKDALDHPLPVKFASGK